MNACLSIANAGAPSRLLSLSFVGLLFIAIHPAIIPANIIFW